LVVDGFALLLREHPNGDLVTWTKIRPEVLDRAFPWLTQAHVEGDTIGLPSGDPAKASSVARQAANV
jgi:hypothetical protein